MKIANNKQQNIYLTNSHFLKLQKQQWPVIINFKQYLENLEITITFGNEIKNNRRKLISQLRTAIGIIIFILLKSKMFSQNAKI